MCPVLQRVLCLLRAVPHHLGRHFPVSRAVFGSCVCGHPGADGLRRVVFSHCVVVGNNDCRKPRWSHVLVERHFKRHILSEPRRGE